MNIKITLKDISWGGRIRKSFQSQVWSTAQEAATDCAQSYSGNMLSSTSQQSLHFLDGGVTETRGSFDAGSGMRWHGKFAKAYIIYCLGYDARKILGDNKIPSFVELKRKL